MIEGHGRTHNEIKVSRFDRGGLVRLIQDGSNSPVVPQVEYIARYCETLGAKTVVVEERYVDRHYLDEFAFFYSRNLVAPASFVRRFHVFSGRFGKDDLARRMAELARRPDSESPKGNIESTYLGFICVRPLDTVPIGRTVLRRLKNREIWATGPYPVHLGNLLLEVDGLAFQQQDVAVGACATAAAWSALSRVTRHEHMRAPTPAEVSESAARHLLSGGRVVPAGSGLTVQQLCEAVRSCGFAPEFVRASERVEVFATTLHAYLLSGIPVILTLRRLDEGHDEGHAVTAVGFQRGKKPTPLFESSVGLRSAWMSKLYIHDDRIGPYARAFLRPIPATDRWKESLALEIETNQEADPGSSEKWLVIGALTPVYPKIRLSVGSLLRLAEAMADTMDRAVGPKFAPLLGVEFLFRRSGEYVRDLTGNIVNPGRAAQAFTALSLPRWCAITPWFVGETPIAEFVYDTTDILRESSQAENGLLLCVVCRHPVLDHVLDQIARKFQVIYV